MFKLALIKQTDIFKQEHIRFGFKSKNQMPLFMIWKEYLDKGKVTYATVLFSIG